MPTGREEGDDTVALPTPAEVEPAWYEVYIRPPVTRLSSPARQRLMFAVLAIAVLLLVLLGGSNLAVTGAIAGAVALAFGSLVFLSTGTREIGISLGPDTVSFGRRGSDLHHWPRSALKAVTIHDAWRGEPVAPSIGQYLVPGYRYLTLERRDGVVAHVSLDSANVYADIIEDVLVHGKPLGELSHPPVHPPAKGPKKPGSSWEREGVDPSVEPLPGPAPTAPTITARPDTAAATSGSGAGAPPPESPTTAAAGKPEGERAPEEILWARAIERHDAVLLAYAPYEVDPHMVMQYPAITDVTCPSTAKFVEALSDASALRSDDYPSSVALSKAYRDAVGALEVAWNAAERYARNVELSLLDPEDQKRLVQARKLLAHAESATADAERAAYFAQVKSLMDDLARSGAIVEPPRVRLAIASRVAKAIAATPSDAE